MALGRFIERCCGWGFWCRPQRGRNIREGVSHVQRYTVTGDDWLAIRTPLYGVRGGSSSSTPSGTEPILLL